MASYPISPELTVYFNDGATFGYPFVLDDPLAGKIGTAVLASTTTGNLVVNVTDQCVKASMSGGYNLLQFQFQAHQATFRLIDPNGDWNPNNPSSPYYGYLTPNRKIRFSANYDGTGYFLFSGYIQAYNYTYAKDNELGYVDLVCVDATRLLNLAGITTISGAIAGETTSERVTKILDQVSFPNTMREIETGSTTVPADPATPRTALAALQNLAFAEQGAFYIGGAGYAEFYNKAHVQGAIGETATKFANDGTGISYVDFKPAYDDKLMVNQATVTRVGGTSQSYSDSASIAKYFPHSVNYDNVMVETDAAALEIAKSFVISRKDTELRIDSLTLDLTTPNYDLGIKAALGVDYFDAIEFKNVGQDGTTIDEKLLIVGVGHEVTPNSWKTTFTLSQPIVKGFILDSAQYGIIGTSAFN